MYYAAACQTNFQAPTDQSQIKDRTQRISALLMQTLISVA